MELKCNKLLSDFPFDLNMRRYIKEHDACGAPEVDESKEDLHTKVGRCRLTLHVYGYRVRCVRM